jgi:hypothetical protein
LYIQQQQQQHRVAFAIAIRKEFLLLKKIEYLSIRRRIIVLRVKETDSK